MNKIKHETWLKTRFPACKELDHDLTLERYDYPPYVREWIRKTG